MAAGSFLQTAPPAWPADLSRDLVRQIEEARQPNVCNGLRFLLAGWAYRQAAEAAGCSVGGLHQAVRAHGLVAMVTGSDRAISLHRRAEQACLEELLERAEEGGLEAEKSKDLSIMSAVHRDKIRDHERANAEPSGALDVLERLAERVAKGELSLELRVTRPEPEEARKSERTIATVETDSRE